MARHIVPLRRELDSIERSLSRRGACSFAACSRALDELEVRVFCGLDPPDTWGALAPPLRTVVLRAAALRTSLEARNERTVARLGRRIATGRYTAVGLERTLSCDGPSPTPAERDRDTAPGYDWRDALLAGLLDAAPLEAEIAPREPELVFYQPTPVRTILSLLERAGVRRPDVLCDIGSGLGHVLAVTALVRGVRAFGIEREPSYCAYARRAFARLALRDVDVVCADARDASFGGANVFFLYTPFRGSVLEQVLGRLEQHARGRKLRICAVGPCVEEFATVSWLVRRDPASGGPDDGAVFESAHADSQ